MNASDDCHLDIGTDIVECLRIAQMIERHGELFLTRVFTPREIEYCSSRKAATQHYAGRWAAKEAILKALGTGWSRGHSLARHGDPQRRGRQAQRGTRRRRQGTVRAAGDRQYADQHLALPHARDGAGRRRGRGARKREE